MLDKMPSELGFLFSFFILGGSGVFLFAIIAIIFTAIFVIGANSIASLLQAPKDAFLQTVSYLRICSAGIIFIIAFNTLGSIFRGLGDSKMPLITVAIACVANIFLDLLWEKQPL